MNSIFFTEASGKYVLDVLKSGFTINDENSEFSDDFIVNWTYPQNIYQTDIIRKIFPDIGNPNAKKRRKDSGFLNVYGDVYPCDIIFLGAQLGELKFQFQFGFGVLKILDKKLSEIDFGTIETENLYDYADVHLGDVYPVLPICFPRIYTNSDLREKYGSFYGGRNFFNDSNAGLVYRNEIASSGKQVIWNLMKPLPFLMFIIKKGFELEGYEVKGDILNDELINSIALDHNNLADEEISADIKKMRVVNMGGDLSNYVKEEVFSIVGVYVVSIFVPNAYVDDATEIEINVIDKQSKAVLFNWFRNGRDREYDREDHMYYPDFSEVFFELPEFKLPHEVIYQVKVNYLGYMLHSIGSDFYCYLNPLTGNEKYLSPNPTLVLSKFMPEGSFKDAINITKKLGNFNVTIKNNKEVHFNHILNIAPNDFIDLSFTEQLDVETTTNEKNYYIMKYSAPEEYEYLDTIIYPNGDLVVGNGSEYKEGEEIDFNCYPLKRKDQIVGGSTAEEMKDGVDGFGLVSYKGLKDGVNNCVDLPSNLLNILFESRYRNTIVNRLNADGLKWKFYSSALDIIKLKSTDSVYAYGSFNKVKNLIKKTNDNDVFEVEIETENRY